MLFHIIIVTCLNAETGKNSKAPTNYLLHVQGSASYNTKATQVATKASSLNSNYCFVLRKAKRYYVWSGLNSTGDQREMAKHFTGKDFELVLEGIGSKNLFI